MIKRSTSLRLTTLALCMGASAIASAHPGDFDKHFGKGGTVTVPAAVRTFTTERVAVDSANRVLFGYGVNPDSAEIAALDEAGNLDTAFGASGFVELGDFKDIKIDSKDRCVVLGHAYSGAFGVQVMRYLSNGSMDASFGMGGVAIVSLDAAFNGAAIAIDENDNIIVAGAESTPASPDMLYAARITNSGGIDDTFGHHGFRTIPLSSSGDDMHAQAVAIDHSGNIFVSGYTAASSPIVNKLVKLKPNGSIDKRFGSGLGVVTSDVSATSTADFTFAGSIAVDAKDNIIIAGGAGTWSASQMFVARYRPDGAPDPIFGGGTYEMFNVGTSVIAQAYGTLIDNRGRIVLTGIGEDGPSGETRLLSVRLKKDGSLDNTFGAGILPTSAWNGAGALTNDGHVLIVGDATTHDSILIDELQGN